MIPSLLRRTAPCLASVALLSTLAAGQYLAPEHPFPGDDLVGPAPGIQEEPALAAGGPGYLVVWEDQRSNLANFTGAVGSPGTGNLTDIYAARYDLAGNLLDPTPILVSTQGMNQTRPQVAWNGTHWLVVFVSQRPDWYFFEDIVGVRVAADGAVVDPVPISIRPESSSPSNDYGENPCVASDGQDWLVAWEAIDWSDNKAIVEGTRIAADGTVLDPSYVTLHKHSDLVFGPEEPQAASIGGEYLVVWHDFGPVRAKRFDGGLTPLTGALTVPGLSGRTRIAASAGQYLLLSTLEAVRISAAGQLLDTTPIDIPSAAPVFTQSAKVDRSRVAWTGTDWAIAYSVPPSGSLFDDPDVWLVRVSAAGAVTTPQPIHVDAGPRSDAYPVVAGDGGGGAFLAYTSSESGTSSWPDVRASRLDAADLASPTTPPSTGLPRQEHLAWVRGPGVHLALFVSRSSGTARILGQRFDDQGSAVDAQPVLIHQGTEGTPYAPSGAWNGITYLVTWLEAGGQVLSRRLDVNLVVQGFGATPLMFGMDGAPEVASKGGDFLVVASDLYSSDLRALRAVRVDGVTGAPLDATPILLSGNYAYSPDVAPLGPHYLVAWTNKGCHDCNTESVRGQVVDTTGALVGGTLTLNGPGEGSAPSLAVAGDRVLVAYVDPSAWLQDAIEGRLVRDDGTLIGGELPISDEPGRQLFPTAGFDGTDFVVAWTDYRDVSGVEQLRGDVYLGRLSLAGASLDGSAGVPVSTGDLSEDFPAVAGAGGHTLVGYLRPDGPGGSPEVPRVQLRRLGGQPVCQPDLGFQGPGTASLSVCGDALVGQGKADLTVSSDKPSAVVFLAYGGAASPTPLFGGTVVPLPAAGIQVLLTDAQGDAVVPGLQAGPTALTVFVQAAVFDPLQAQGFQLTNAVQIDFLP